MNGSLRMSYLLLALVAVACAAFYIFLPLVLEGWRSFSLNMMTEVVGILLTVALIDAVIRRRQEKERMRYRSIALQQLLSMVIQKCR
jgi:hypothetical protein